MDDFKENIFYSQFLDNISSKKIKIGIIGLGYVGLPLALEFCKQEIKVIGFDINKSIVDNLNQGISHIHHIDSKLIKEAFDSNHFTASCNFLKIKEVDAIIICVPTPLGEKQTPDISHILENLKNIKDYLKKGHLISLESTTYPGTTQEVLKPFIENMNFKIGNNFFLIYSPEREDPGNKKYKINQIPKLIGGDTIACKELGSKLYELINPNVITMSSTKTAETTKLLENVYRSVNIGLINELKEFTQEINVDIYEIINAAASKPFGYMPFYPGPGVGGHCIPIDPYYLLWKAKEKGMTIKLIELAGEINASIPINIINKLSKEFERRKKSLKGSKILILGISYKKNIDDCRESPSLLIMNKLIKKGVDVSYYDPFFKSINCLDDQKKILNCIELNKVNISSQDCVLLLTDHDCFDYELIKNNSKLIIDTRGRFENSKNIIIG